VIVQEHSIWIERRAEREEGGARVAVEHQHIAG
jgi:hypothetical protein